MVTEVHPSVLILLSGWNVPSAMLRINQVQVCADEAMLFKGADTGKIGVVLKVAFNLKTKYL